MPPIATPKIPNITSNINGIVIVIEFEYILLLFPFNLFFFKISEECEVHNFSQFRHESVQVKS